MKIFKRIYYPIMVVLLAFMLVISFVDANVGGGKSRIDTAKVNEHIAEIAKDSHNSINTTNLERVKDYIVKTLNTDIGIVLDDGGIDDKDNMNIADYATKEGKIVPTMVIQTALLKEETVKDISTLDDSVNMVDKTVKNIIVSIPGSKSIAGNNGDAIVLMAHYDSRPEGAGASDNAIAAASMIENIRYIMENNIKYENDLVFVFTDAEEEGMFGAYAFKHQFKGFNDIYARVKLGTNYDSLGNKGSLLMFQTSNKNDKLISEYSKINGNTFTSSIANFVYNTMSNFTDFNIFGDIPSLNFANVGGNDVYHTPLDSVKNVSQDVVKQQSEMMYKVSNYFGNMDLNDLNGSSNAVFFSYLDIVTIWYPAFVSFIFAGIIVGLVAAIIILNKKRKAFSLGKAASGAIVQILTLFASLLVLFVSYYIFSLLLVGFGVIPLEAIGSLTYSNIGLLSSVMLFSVACAAAFYVLFKKTFNIKASDVVRGNVLLFAVLGLILSLATPQLGYFIAIIAILELVVMLLTTIFKDKFKAKFNMDIERLFLYVWPVIITLPLVIPIMSLAATVLKAVMLPVIMMLFILLIGFVAPYFSYLKPVMDKAFMKLPKHTIRVERTRVERIEDKAKKGKFTEETVTRVENEKVEWRYKNRIGIAAIAIVASVMILLFSGFGATYAQNLVGSGSYNNYIYNDSLVYVWEKDGGQVNGSWQVQDKIAYKYISRALTGLKWNADKKAYVKEDSALKVIANGNEPTVSKKDSVYTFKTYESSKSQIILKLTDTKTVTKLTFKDKGGRESIHTNDEGLEKLEFRLPYGYGDFTLEVEGATTLNIDYTEMRIGNDSLQGFSEWDKLISHFDGKESVLPYIKGGIVLKNKITL